MVSTTVNAEKANSSSTVTPPDLEPVLTRPAQDYVLRMTRLPSPRELTRLHLAHCGVVFHGGTRRFTPHASKMRHAMHTKVHYSSQEQGVCGRQETVVAAACMRAAWTAKRAAQKGTAGRLGPQ